MGAAGSRAAAPRTAHEPRLASSSSCRPLPPEIWIEILLYLDYLDLKRCSQLNKPFQRLAALPCFDAVLFRAAPAAAAAADDDDELLPAAAAAARDFKIHPLLRQMQIHRGRGAGARAALIDRPLVHYWPLSDAVVLEARPAAAGSTLGEDAAAYVRPGRLRLAQAPARLEHATAPAVRRLYVQSCFAPRSRYTPPRSRHQAAAQDLHGESCVENEAGVTVEQLVDGFLRVVQCECARDRVCVHGPMFEFRKQDAAGKRVVLVVPWYGWSRPWPGDADDVQSSAKWRPFGKKRRENGALRRRALR